MSELVRRPSRRCQLRRDLHLKEPVQEPLIAFVLAALASLELPGRAIRFSELTLVVTVDLREHVLERDACF
jgi:hypothetical protein